MTLQTTGRFGGDWRCPKRVRQGRFVVNATVRGAICDPVLGQRGALRNDGGEMGLREIDPSPCKYAI